MATGKIKKVAGPLVIAEGMRDANMYDVVRVSESRLIGEIIEMHGDQALFRFTERHRTWTGCTGRVNRNAAVRRTWTRTDQQYL